MCKHSGSQKLCSCVTQLARPLGYRLADPRAHCLCSYGLSQDPHATVLPPKFRRPGGTNHPERAKPGQPGCPTENRSTRRKLGLGAEVEPLDFQDKLRCKRTGRADKVHLYRTTRRTRLNPELGHQELRRVRPAGDSSSESQPRPSATTGYPKVPEARRLPSEVLRAVANLPCGSLGTTDTKPDGMCLAHPPVLEH